MGETAVAVPMVVASAIIISVGLMMVVATPIIVPSVDVNSPAIIAGITIVITVIKTGAPGVIDPRSGTTGQRKGEQGNPKS
jgi:hypothetical protein